MRSIRVRAENGELFAARLRDSGFRAEWLGPGTADTSLFGGCSDPGCCWQHDARYRPEQWGAIRTDASGHQAHAIWALHEVVS